MPGDRRNMSVAYIRLMIRAAFFFSNFGIIPSGAIRMLAADVVAVCMQEKHEQMGIGVFNTRLYVFNTSIIGYKIYYSNLLRKVQGWMMPSKWWQVLGTNYIVSVRERDRKWNFVGRSRADGWTTLATSKGQGDVLFWKKDVWKRHSVAALLRS